MNADSILGCGRVRPPGQAGRFYPADPAQLRKEVSDYLDAAPRPTGPVPKALIAPHAGYMYSGPIAGSAYARLESGRDQIRRVVLVGPSHFARFNGVAASGMDAFATPLGNVPLDRAGIARAASLPGVAISEDPHREEHSLEVHIPFLQVVLGEFELVPLLVGEATQSEVARLLEVLWGGPESCIVASSDLSHYHDYYTARQMDQATARAIEAFEGERLDGHDACGFQGVRGLLEVARDRGLECRAIDLRNSGDTAGSRSRVVGYGAFVLTTPGK
ncbi:MAG TPA: AmmeMemoRadiSam system protein B [Verrucomicrobiota bacterium]|nr:AmmeMemoRadiSam system protein B [Verrucomicrobiota bacterium]